MKRLISILLIVCAFFALFSVTAFAAESAESTNEGENIIEILYAFCVDNADKILSALAFLGSILIAFTYRRGFLPLIKGSLNTLGSTVSKITDENSKMREDATVLFDMTKKHVSAALSTLDSVINRVIDLEFELNSARDNAEAAESLRVVMEAQIDMLYEIFMSSSIPAYQKESVGEKIAAMKKAIAPTEQEND